MTHSLVERTWHAWHTALKLKEARRRDQIRSLELAEILGYERDLLELTRTSRDGFGDARKGFHKAMIKRDSWSPPSF